MRACVSFACVCTSVREYECELCVRTHVYTSLACAYKCVCAYKRVHVSLGARAGVHSDHGRLAGTSGCVRAPAPVLLPDGVIAPALVHPLSCNSLLALPAVRPGAIMPVFTSPSAHAAHAHLVSVASPMLPRPHTAAGQ